MMKKMDYIYQIAEAVSKDVGVEFSRDNVNIISREAEKTYLSDSAILTFLDANQPGAALAILTSNPGFPKAVLEDTAMARKISAASSAEVASHIMKPVSSGQFGLQTFAAFPKMTSVAGTPILGRFQKRRLAPNIVTWLSNLALQTKTEISDEAQRQSCFFAPLSRMASDEELPEVARVMIERILENLSPSLSLFTVAEHGDFWVGNILLDTRSMTFKRLMGNNFSVIDWRGARLDGMPCIDLVRFFSSVFGRPSILEKGLIKKYQKTLDINKFEFGFYCFVSLAHIGENLENFPKNKYYDLVIRVSKYLADRSLI